ncbi:unnamed protein product [Bursaphelenchus xylophilus]|uniref:(pine wood nematode) hypothetical protein n=1 Tax=Bursaphelenchus xylophilus TaxID=6326 RepID=A0A1I7RRW2_BURXY|nr:unnamed protein product [Bursaphelenchus xylophilus]CAG9123437.1 unnamed protein product [Bursaphelenchus xylophilus]
MPGYQLYLHVMLVTDLPSTAVKDLAAILFTLLALNGLLLNCLWALILIMGHRHFSRRPFYIISRHLLVCDLLCISGQVVLAVPLTIMDYHHAWAYKRTNVFNVFSTFETVGHMSTLTFVFLQSLSQIAPFLPNQKQLIYHLSSSGTVICMFGWIFNIGLMVAMYMTKCRKDFDLFDFHFYFICTEDRETAEFIWMILNIVVVVIISSAYFIYIMGFKNTRIRIRALEAKGSLNEDDKRELIELRKRRLIILQGLLIVTMLTLRMTAYYVFAPMLKGLDRDVHTVGSVLSNCVEMISSSVHPCIYIRFNERAHKYFLKIISSIKPQREIDETTEFTNVEISRMDK